MSLEVKRSTAQPGQPLVQSSAWPIQAVTGILLIIVVFLHMFFNHFQEGGMFDAAGVVLHISNPLIFILEILFIIFVTYHALLGLRAIIFDLSPSQPTRRKINTILTIVGIVTIMYGIVLAWLIRSQLLA